MWLDKVANTRDEKIELINLFVDGFYKNVSRFEPNISDIQSETYFVTLEDARNGDEVNCLVNDFEFKGFNELSAETNADIHWAVFVCGQLQKKADKKRYWQQFKKFTLQKDASLKDELKNSQPDFNSYNTLNF